MNAPEARNVVISIRESLASLPGSHLANQATLDSVKRYNSALEALHQAFPDKTAAFPEPIPVHTVPLLALENPPVQTHAATNHDLLSRCLQVLGLFPEAKRRLGF